MVTLNISIRNNDFRGKNMPKLKEPTKLPKKLEDYQPGATRNEVMASLKKVLAISKQSKEEIKDNGKTN